MKKRLLKLSALVCALCLMGTGLLFPAARAENGKDAEPEILTGYFVTAKIIRPTPMRAGDSLGLVQPYEPVTLTKVDRQWGVMPMENGKPGYVFLDGLLPLPEYEKTPEVERYSPVALPVTGFPAEGAPVTDTLQDWELCVEDGRYEDFIHIRIPGRDTVGYVPSGRLKELDFPMPVEAITLTVICDREAELTALPLKGAEVTGHLPADTMVTAFDAGWGAHLMIREAGEVSWVRRDDVCACVEDEESGLPMFVPLGEDAETGPEVVFRYATVAEGGTKLIGSDGLSTRLEAGERVLVCFTYSHLAAVTGQSCVGFAPLDGLVTESVADKAAHIQALDLSGAGLEKSEWLDAAFTMLEEDNSLLLRYNAATGSDIQALFPLGVPYFWGGRSISLIRQRLPEYNTTAAWQSSPVYYRKGTPYLTGFDCVGFVKSVCQLAGHPIRDALKNLIIRDYHNRGDHVWCKADNPMPEDWKKVAEALEIGDILVLFHPGEHVLMYAGTLRQYGYTEETLPAVADYLDNPLMIQCGEDPFYYLRMTEYIASSKDARVAPATPPDGGVNFCLLGVPFEAAELVFMCHDSVYPCFLAEGTCINIYNFDTVTNYVFYRPPVATATVPPDPSATPAPSETPAPTETPDPTKTPNPTETPAP